MQFTQEQTKPCEVDLRIEIEVDVVNSAIDKAYKDFAKSTKVPGFRPGKAPRVVLEKYVGDEAAKEHALDTLIQPAYLEALEQADIDPWAPAKIDIVDYELGSPLVFTAKVPLAPKVEIGPYTGLDIERKMAQVTDEMVEGEINAQLKRHATYNKIEDRPAKVGDSALIEAVDEASPYSEPFRDVLVVGQTSPEMDKDLEGMSVGEEKTTAVTHPDDMADEESGPITKSIRYKLLELHEPILPELNDEWVKSTYATPANEEEATDDDPADVVDTVDKLRSKIREIMENSATAKADAEVKEQIIDKVIEVSKIDYPDAMVEERVDERVEALMDSLQKREVTLEAYLNHIGKDYEQLRADYAGETEEGLKANLVLYEIIEKEGIKVEDGDIEAEVALLAQGRNLPPETVQAFVDSAGQSKEIQSRILHKKVLDFLAGVSNIKDVG